jgi:hypothetical protein
MLIVSARNRIYGLDSPFNLAKAIRLILRKVQVAVTKPTSTGTGEEIN